MESDDYKAMCEIVIRQINNRKDELNKAVQHETKNNIEKPRKDLPCNNCYMRRTNTNLEQNDDPKDLYCKRAKININRDLFLPQDFSKKQIAICKHAYDEIAKEGFFDVSLDDCQKEYERKVKKEMQFQIKDFTLGEI